MLRLSRADLLATPPGWAEELQDGITGVSLAQQILEKRAKRQTMTAGERPGQVVYGMPGRHLVPGKGVQ